MGLHRTHLFVAFALVMTTACTTLGPPETLAPREAVLYGTRVAETLGNSQGVPCGLDRSPIIVLAEPPLGETQAGYDNRRTEGGTGTNDPFGCDRWKMHEYAGAIVFDLSDFTEAVIVDSAVLTLTRAPSTIPWRETDIIRDEPGCVIEISAVGEAWTDNYVIGPAGTSFPRSARTRGVERNDVRGADRTNMLMTDVTDIALGWLARREPNHGFRIRQNKVDGSGISHENNGSCTNVYSDAMLALTVRRFAPREP